MSDLFLRQADLANGASGVADGEDRDSMAFAALTLGAAGSMTDGALEQGAAEDVARGGGAERGGVRVAGWPSLDSSSIATHTIKQIARKMSQKNFGPSGSASGEPYTRTAILPSRHAPPRLAIQTKRSSRLRKNACEVISELFHCVLETQKVMVSAPLTRGRRSRL